jgi:hypothetical protein
MKCQQSGADPAAVHVPRVLQWLASRGVPGRGNVTWKRRFLDSTLIPLATPAPNLMLLA